MKKSYGIASVLAGIGVLAGCSNSSGGTPANGLSLTRSLRVTVAAVTASRPLMVAARTKAAPAKRTSVPKGLEGVGLTGSGLSAVLPDPKHPGKPLWMIWAKSVGGNFASGSATVQGVTALMFHVGHRAAKMTAPQANYDDGTKTIVASGGVAYASLTQPGTWMRARTVTYHADTGNGVARGGVVIHDGKNGGTVHTPVVYFDSGLKTIQSYPIRGGH